MASYADMLDPVRPAVVSVTSESIVETLRGGSPAEEFLRRFFGEPMPGPRGQQPPESRGAPNQEPEERRVPNGLGSGVIVSPDGYILTNNHVVSTSRGGAADRIMVQLNDLREVEAELIGRDERTDIALLKIDETHLPYVRMADSENLRVGDLVFAIGNPLGVGQTTTMGIVSATGRTNLGILGADGYESFIQTDAAINRGNSGGALVDAEGRLVGINSAIISPIGANIGIGFAIPSRIAKQVADSLVETGSVQRGYVGVSIGDLSPDLAAAFDFDSTRGVLVQGVQEGSPAEAADLRRGDIITALNGRPVKNASELRFEVAGMRPGTEVTLAFVREGKQMAAELTLGSLDDVGGTGTAREVLEGVTLRRVDEEMQQAWNLSEQVGVVITDINARSPYSGALQPGMVILEVNGVTVNSVSDFSDAIRTGAINRLWVSYRGTSVYLALRVREPAGTPETPTPRR